MRFESPLPSSQRDLGTNADENTTRSTQGGGLMSLKSADLNYNTVQSTDSFSLSQQNQLEFIQDNIDYQWFIDYGYRDGASSLQRSSILSASCYDDLSRDLDTTLAHVDMEDFSHEDINSLLHALPPMCVRDLEDREGEMYASLPSTSPHSSSLVKSGPLFSPVKEVALVPAGTYSVDSLDCDEMMITCQHPNKHNYTIAFQGSTVMTNSDTNESSEDGSKAQHAVTVEKPLSSRVSNLKQDSRCGEMSNSDSPLTTWSKLAPEGGSSGGLSRASSGNNNSAPIGGQFDGAAAPLDFKPLQSACSVPSLLQTQSMPNLVSNKHQQWLLRNKLLALNSSINAAEKAFDVPIKLFDIAQSSAASSSSLLTSSIHSNASKPPTTSSSSTKVAPKHTTTPSHQPNFSLLKLFIKQKNDGNLNYMSWNDDTGETEPTPVEKSNAANVNVAWASRLNGNTVPSSVRGKNLNRTAKYLENNNNEYSYDSLTADKNGHVDNEEHMSVSQVSERYCDCDISSQNEELSSQEMGESSDSFSSHTNRPTVRSMGKGSTSEDTLGTETARRDSKAFLHRVGCPMFDKSIQTSHVLAASASKSQQSKLAGGSKTSGGSSGCRAVYILYPNYTLPDLSFLRDHATELDLNNVFLWPQKFEPSPVAEQTPPLVESKARPGRPMSCVDIDTLKRKGFRHVRDWSSLIYLLPREYTRLLSDIPEVAAHLNDPALLDGPTPTPLFCTKRRPPSCGESTTSSSNAPSSGYRGSSSILNEETASNPLFIYRYDSVSSESSMLGGQAPTVPKRNQSLASGPEENVPPRPPLPKSILRHPGLGDEYYKLKSKRFSMFEFGSKENLAYEEAANEQNTTNVPQYNNKRASLPSNFVDKKDSIKDHHDVWEDEGVEVGGTDTTMSSELHEESAHRLDEEEWMEKDISSLRAQVIKFLNCNNREAQQQRKVVSFVHTPPNSPTSGGTSAKQLYQCKLQSGGISGAPIREERESSSPEIKLKQAPEAVQKDLIEGVIKATRHLVNNFSSEQISTTSQIALNSLCPALYALLNEGLRPALSTSFGDTPNSVWQVIEVSAQPGPSTQSLYDLVLRLNTENILLSEGLLKFNAFIFGLLNIRGLDTWLSLVVTRESLLRRHYIETSLLSAASRGLSGSKTLLDLLINALKPLNALPFKLDLLYQSRTLHESLSALARNSPMSPLDPVGSSLRTSWTLKKLIRSITASQEEGLTRPRSCVEVQGDSGSDVASSANKRWSTLGLGSKLALAFQSLVAAEEDEYPDSLEPEPAVVSKQHYAVIQPLENKRLTSLASHSTADDTSSDLSDLPDLSYNSEATIQNSAGSKCTGGKFKRLQQRWEMLSGTPLHTPASSPIKSRSRIPRPVSSPTPPPSTSFSKPSGMPLPKPVARKPPLPSPTGTSAPPLIRKPALSPTAAGWGKFPASMKYPMDGKSEGPALLPSKMSFPSRVSRVDSTPRPPASRPSSLPYRKPVVANESRRAASSGVAQRQKIPGPATTKYVKTLSHRLPADNGHLSYNAGERLKVVLEVDDKWLLCCRGRQKGLVPRAAVILY